MPKIHDWIQQTLEEAHTIYTVEIPELVEALATALDMIIETNPTEIETLKVLRKELGSMDYPTFLIEPMASLSLNCASHWWNPRVQPNPITRWFLDSIYLLIGSKKTKRL